MGMKSKIYYNALIRYNLTSFLKILIATCTTLNMIDFGTSDVSQGITSIALLCILLLIPFLYMLVLCKGFRKLGYPSKREKYGSLHDKMSVKTKAGIMY